MSAPPPRSADQIVLPLQFIDQPGGTVIRCLCGAELALAQRGLANELLRLRQSAYRTHMGPDLSPAGVLRMTLHARNCSRGRQLLASR